MSPTPGASGPVSSTAVPRAATMGDLPPGADLVVVGGGTMGAWTALRGVDAGRRTVLLDAFGVGSSRSTSGDVTRIIRSSHGDDGFHPVWSRRAREAWIALGERTGEAVFVEAGCLWFARREGAIESASLVTLRGLGIPVERLTPDEIAARWPGVAVDDLAFGLFEPEGGLLLARRGVLAVERAFVASGGTSAIADARPGRSDGDRLIDVELGDGRRLAGDAFVFACGPWLRTLFPDELGGLLEVTKQTVPYFGLPAGDQRFAAPTFPSWIDDEATTYGVPAVAGKGFKAGSDAYGPPFDPTHGDRTPDLAQIDAIRAYIARRFPGLGPAPLVETRVCQYETTPDAQFLLDRHPRWRNVWIAGGGSGHGFKHGPVIGETLLRLIDGHRTDDDARFALDRDFGRSGAALRPGAKAPVS